MIPKKLIWNSTVFEFVKSKQNILIYEVKGEYYYEDWIIDPEIIIVQYRKELPLNDAFYVLFYLEGRGNYKIHTNNISHYKNRIAKPIID